MAVRREVKQPFYGLDLLNRKMSKLIPQLPEEQTARAGPRQEKQNCQPRHVPECQACSKMTWAEPHVATRLLHEARTLRLSRCATAWVRTAHRFSFEAGPSAH